MFYKLLGMIVWNGAKLYLGKRYGSKALVLGGALVIGVGAAALLAKRSTEES
jgi:hypothetical protein